MFYVSQKKSEKSVKRVWYEIHIFGGLFNVLLRIIATMKPLNIIKHCDNTNKQTSDCRGVLF